MRVGIITFQRANNLGAVLQCYALNRYLVEKGVNAEVIDYRNEWMERNFRVLPEFRKNLIQWMRLLLPALKCYKERKMKYDKFTTFRKQIRFSKEYSYLELLKEGLTGYDVLISGSDQVWNPIITNGLDKIYFQDFETKAVRASYAISLGNVLNKEYENPTFWENVKRFDYISCREQDAVQYIQDNLGDREVVQCVDPVLLLSAKEWIELVKNVRINTPRKYILLYSVEQNDELDNIALDLGKNKGIQVVAIDRKINNSHVINMCGVGPEEFVKLILEADSVVTSSFHATAFSCIFSKELFCMLHSHTGMRVISITEMFGVRNRVFNSYDDYRKNADNTSCNYERGRYIVARECSEKYLANICEGF